MHAQTDFRTRDMCRHEVEDLARRSEKDEQEVAAVAVRLAAERLRRGESNPREGTVGYFLIDEGRPELEAKISYRVGLRRFVGAYLAVARCVYTCSPSGC